MFLDYKLNKSIAKTRFVSVWLEYHKEIQPAMFYCPRCRCPILQYSGNLISLMPGGKDETAPIIAKCHTPTCGLKFKIYGIIDEQ